MSDSDQGTKQLDSQALQAEIERLKAENEALKSTVEEPHDSRRMRTGFGLALAVAAALLLSLAIPTVWLNRVVMDTDTWVATVAPLAEDPAIQDAVASVASDRIIEALDAEARLREVLPEGRLQELAPIIANSAEGFIRTQATNMVRSEQFPALWEEINRTGHAALIASLTGQKSDGAVTYIPGTLTLDVGTLAEKIQSKLVDAGLPFLARIPVSSINKQVTLFHSPLLESASMVIGTLNQIALVLPILAIGLAAAAFALAADRRKVALWLGASIVVVTVLPLQAVYLSQLYVAQQLQQLLDLPAAAAENAYGIVFAGLTSAETTIAVLGAVVLLSAIIAGPAGWAVTVRQSVTGGLEGLASHLELGRFGEWVARRKQPLRTAGIIGAVLILLALPAPRSIAQIVWLAVLALVWVLAVELLGAHPAPGVAAEATGVGMVSTAEMPGAEEATVAPEETPKVDEVAQPEADTEDEQEPQSDAPADSV